MAVINKDGIAYVTAAELFNMLQTNNFTVDGFIPRIVVLQDTSLYLTLTVPVDIVNTILSKAQIGRIFMNATPE